jgi:hypothetical protein
MSVTRLKEWPKPVKPEADDAPPQNGKAKTVRKPKK